MTTWRMEPDGHRTWYVPAHRAHAAAMAEGVEMTEGWIRLLGCCSEGDRRQEG